MIEHDRREETSNQTASIVKRVLYNVVMNVNEKREVGNVLKERDRGPLFRETVKNQFRLTRIDPPSIHQYAEICEA